MEFYFDRTGIETWHECHRKYFWARLWGKGVEGHPGGLGGKQNLSAHFGSAFHLMWEGVVGGKGEKAIDEAVKYYDVGAMEMSLGPKTEEGEAEFQAQVMELRLMLEGYGVLLQEWALGQLQVGYEVVAVEAERQIPMVDDGVDQTIFNSRPDGILKAKDGTGLATLSVKTHGWFGKDEEEAYKVDLQGLTEGWAADGAILNVMRMVAVKGQRKKRALNWMGTMIESSLHGNPLAMGYCQVVRDFNGEVVSQNWCWSQQTPKASNASGFGYISKSYVPTLVSGYPGGARQWARDLLAGKIQEEMTFEPSKWLILQPPEMRFLSDSQDAAAEVSALSWDIASRGKLVEGKQGADLVQVLNEQFPRDRGSCFQFNGHRCEFFDVCRSGDQRKVDNPLEWGYRLRDPHHPEERVG